MSAETDILAAHQKIAMLEQAIVNALADRDADIAKLIARLERVTEIGTEVGKVQLALIVRLQARVTELQRHVQQLEHRAAGANANLEAWNQTADYWGGGS